MGLYNFKPRFAPLILDGSKTHTIRAKRANPDKPGNTLHLYTGLRQKGARLLGRWPCVRVEDITIMIDTLAGGRVWINDEELDHRERNLLAWRDGFRCYSHCADEAFTLMLGFWLNTHGAGVFCGDIIHWDYSKPVEVRDAC